MSRAAAPARALHVDALKALASQAIVLHHLAFYGPMADHAAALWPALFDVLAGDARIAVQVFLVVGGWLAARSLAPGARLRPGVRAGAVLLERYLRLVLPLAATLALAIGAAALARTWMDHASIPAPPTAAQVLAHLVLLQDLLGIEALSAGVWYVAIDLQLYALLLALLLTARVVVPARHAADDAAPSRAAAGLVFALAAVSLLVVNRDAAWDVTGPYFFGAYAMGVLVAWWARPQAVHLPGLVLLACLVVVALWLQWRSRIALAALVAAALAIAPRVASHKAAGATGPTAVVHALGRISYAVFLVHFPWCLVVNAVFERFAPHTPAVQAAGLLLAWAGSVAAGALFHRAVEVPAMRWAGTLKSRPARGVARG